MLCSTEIFFHITKAGQKRRPRFASNCRRSLSQRKTAPLTYSDWSLPSPVLGFVHLFRLKPLTCFIFPICYIGTKQREIRAVHITKSDKIGLCPSSRELTLRAAIPRNRCCLDNTTHFFRTDQSQQALHTHFAHTRDHYRKMEYRAGGTLMECCSSRLAAKCRTLGTWQRLCSLAPRTGSAPQSSPPSPCASASGTASTRCLHREKRTQWAIRCC